MQALQLAFRDRVEVDASNALLGTSVLQPTEKNPGSTGIGDGALAQTTLDLRVIVARSQRAVLRGPEGLGSDPCRL